MSESINELRYCFPAPQRRYSRKVVATICSPVGAALPRITRLMALAIKLDEIRQQCPALDALELARRSCVSRCRITQILNLLHLAPDIQERLLGLAPLAQGREVISEKSLRRLAGEYRWERQRERFALLLSRRGATGSEPVD